MYPYGKSYFNYQASDFKSYSSYICKGCIISMCCSKACNRVILTITTTFGDRFKVNPKGQIIRPDIKSEPSDNWIMLGIDHVKRNQFIPLAELTPENIKDFKPWKNGKSQWTVRDLDHGTIRILRSNKFYGIKGMYFTEN